jgi:hypothetical protein
LPLSYTRFSVSIFFGIPAYKKVIKPIFFFDANINFKLFNTLKNQKPLTKKLCLYICMGILIKFYMNANIMNTQIVGNWRSQKLNFMFILTLTYVLMDKFLSNYFFLCFNMLYFIDVKQLFFHVKSRDSEFFYRQLIWHKK